MAWADRAGYRIAAIALSLAATGAAPAGDGAAEAADASAFIVELGEQATTTMTDPALSPADRLRRFGLIVDRDFDIPKLTQFMLGPYWQGASPAERAAFAEVFRDYIIRIYSDNFAQYRSDSFRVLGQRPAGERMTIVRSEIVAVASTQPIAIEWRLVKKPEGFRVIDLSVDEVSLAFAQQAECTAAIARNGGQIAALISLMRLQLEQMDAVTP